MEWIRVDNHLPEEHEEVFTYGETGICTAEIAWFDEGIPYWMCRGEFSVDPTHWMPLPDPPKEEINRELYLNKNFIFPDGNQIEWGQDFMCYSDNIPHGIKFKLTDFINDDLVKLVAYGYGIISTDEGSYGSGAICADIKDIMEFVLADAI